MQGETVADIGHAAISIGAHTASQAGDSGKKCRFLNL
jgi:hypothetical protein